MNSQNDSISPRQQQVLDILQEHFEGSDIPPTITQLSEMSGISRNTIWRAISHLASHGHLSKEIHRHGTVRLVGQPEKFARMLRKTLRRLDDGEDPGTLAVEVGVEPWAMELISRMYRMFEP
jgi:DNA-binding FadR family transcriptional regulator